MLIVRHYVVLMLLCVYIGNPRDRPSHGDSTLSSKPKKATLVVPSVTFSEHNSVFPAHNADDKGVDERVVTVKNPNVANVVVRSDIANEVGDPLQDDPDMQGQLPKGASVALNLLNLRPFYSTSTPPLPGPNASAARKKMTVVETFKLVAGNSAPGPNCEAMLSPGVIRDLDIKIGDRLLVQGPWNFVECLPVSNSLMNTSEIALNPTALHQLESGIGDTVTIEIFISQTKPSKPKTETKTLKTDNLNAHQDIADVEMDAVRNSANRFGSAKAVEPKPEANIFECSNSKDHECSEDVCGDCKGSCSLHEETDPFAVDEPSSSDDEASGREHAPSSAENRAIWTAIENQNKLLLVLAKRMEDMSKQLSSFHS